MLNEFLARTLPCSVWHLLLRSWVLHAGTAWVIAGEACDFALLRGRERFFRSKNHQFLSCVFQKLECVAVAIAGVQLRTRATDKD